MSRRGSQRLTDCERGNQVTDRVRSIGLLTPPRSAVLCQRFGRLLPRPVRHERTLRRPYHGPAPRVSVTTTARWTLQCPPATGRTQCHLPNHLAERRYRGHPCSDAMFPTNSSGVCTATRHLEKSASRRPSLMKSFVLFARNTSEPPPACPSRCMTSFCWLELSSAGRTRGKRIEATSTNPAALAHHSTPRHRRTTQSRRPAALQCWVFRAPWPKRARTWRSHEGAGSRRRL